MADEKDLYGENPDNPQHPPGYNPNEDLDTLMKVISFCVPLVGIILYFVNKSDKPRKAKSACNMALWGIAFGFLINIIYVILLGGL